MSAFTAMECSIVIEAKKGEIGGRELDLLLHRAHIDIVSMDTKQYEIALAAWRKYGKGGHRASLNRGDCCSYALSIYSAESLLSTGRDFSFTDVTTAAYS
jgi:ribonuclease VapC